MGDGVNVAARLEGICEPGAICLSEDAYRQVRDKLREPFVDLGEQNLKNIARPVRAYALKARRNSRRRGAAHGRACVEGGGQSCCAGRRLPPRSLRS